MANFLLYRFFLDILFVIFRKATFLHVSRQLTAYACLEKSHGFLCPNFEF